MGKIICIYCIKNIVNNKKYIIAGLNSHLGLKRTQETKDKIRKSNWKGNF